ncbi:MAG: guanylate kinase [Bacillota bacterium]|nr:guanylate kinase [Bacillota bacterium]
MNENKGLGLLLVVSGPSGVGKGTVCKALLDRDDTNVFSVSATTRSPRPADVDGQSYYFMTKEEFFSRLDKGDFLEWAEVYGNYYGTLRPEVERLQKAGKNVVLEIDTQGAMQIKKMYPESVLVFILPPSLEELRARIVGRGTETPEVLELRLSKAEAEIALSSQYDLVLINDDVERTVEALAAFIHEERIRRKRGGFLC